jgi:hypothetical protein
MVARRVEFGDKYTIGRLYIDGSSTPECYTLEDKVRPDGEKVFGETAIPAGRYRVVIDHSTHFNKDLPHVLDVPGFEGIRIHSGNTDLDTEGCLLVGRDWPGGDKIMNSHIAFESLYPKIQKALDSGEQVFLEIINT